METYTVKDLYGAALDVAVAKAEYEGGHVTGIVCGEGFQPSRRWEDAGPIIERERLHIGPFSERWAAWAKGYPAAEDSPEAYGPTPLIAAMRAYLSSKFGDVVELP